MARHPYIVTTHAIHRYRERGGLRSLDDELIEASRFGAQSGRGFMLILPCGLVAAGKSQFRDRGWQRAIVTVLTQDQAIANMQAQMLLINRRPSDRINRRRKHECQERERR